eukprot:PITA_10538
MYVPVHYGEKNECWKTLIEYIEQCSPTNIIIGGDLNIILDPKEKRGGSYTRDPFLLTVENLIQSWDLVDFKLVKGTYTWTNNRTWQQHISPRLDRFLASSAIMMDNRMVLSMILPKLTSNHKPIILHIKEEEDLGPLSFRFSPLWAKREGFLDTACRGFEQIKEAAVNHFQNLLSAGKDGSEEDMEEFLINIPQLVSLEDNESLIRPASEEEIINIAWSMEPDKSPGPDGFSIHFSRIFWEIIKTDLMRMVQGFMRKAIVGGGINSTFLALIPKENNPGTFDRYRPISLCNSSYKILAKLMENRIKPLLQKLITPAQGGFVKG